MLNTKVRKIGGSHGVILPQQAIAALEIPEGTELDVRFDAHRIVLERKGARPSRAEFLQMLDEVLTENAVILRELAK